MAGFTSIIGRGTNPTFTAGANGANALIPVEASRQIWSVALEKSVVLRFAKKQDMGSHLKDMPVLAAKPDAYWLTAEAPAAGSMKQTTSMDWKNKRLTAEEVAVLVAIPQNVLSDSNYDLWSYVKDELGEAIGRALDAAVIFGTNKPAGWTDAALVPGALTANNKARHGTAVAPKDVGSDISNAIASVEADGFTPTGIVMAQQLRSQLRDLRDTTGQFVFHYGSDVSTSSFGDAPGDRTATIYGLPATTTLSGIFEEYDAATSNAAELVVVDWNQVVIGVRQDITFDFSKEAVISNATGGIVLNAWQMDSVVLRCVARFGYAVPNPTTRLNPGAEPASRWPAGILEMAA